MKKLLTRLVLLAALIVFVLVAVDERVIIRQYTIETDKLDTPVSLAVLTDLHGDGYGPAGADLVSRITRAQPDAVLMVGDMFSPDGYAEEELTFFRALAEIAPCFYVTGNHEYWEYDVSALVADISETGVTVLDQSCAPLTTKGQIINICGIPDPVSGVTPQKSLSRTASAVPSEGYTVLLSHRPELIDQYAAAGVFDLVLCGHAHGGQVRIPGLVNGLYAPNQGLFPKYAGGRYAVDDTTMIVSRGLVYSLPVHIPRVFNRPELVLVTIK